MRISTVFSYFTPKPVLLHTAEGASVNSMYLQYNKRNKITNIKITCKHVEPAVVLGTIKTMQTVEETSLFMPNSNLGGYLENVSGTYSSPQ